MTAAESGGKPLILPLGILALKRWLLWFLDQRKALFKL